MYQYLYGLPKAKKTASACKAGITCLGIGGVWVFKSKSGLLQEWDNFTLQGRKVYIIFDSDIVDKPQVKYAEYVLANELKYRGAIVQLF